jgi:predicted flap endonuclease-1-like 5' DNA nuclease
VQAAPLPAVETAPDSEIAATAEAADSATEIPEAELTGDIDLSDPAEMAKFKRELQYVEGIGPAYAGKLEQASLTTCLDLLRAGATRKGREAIVAQTGLSSALVLKWVNHVDLYRIKGVGSEYADLLEAAGVDTVVELAQRNPGNLYARMVEVNQEKALVRQMPTTGQVADWIGQAKGLPRVVSY